MPPSSTPSDADDLLYRVEQTLAAHHMLAEGDRVLVGVSGGPDSMALLHLLNRLAPRLHVSLGVAHLHHGLRGASADREAQLVRRTAAALDCPCHIQRACIKKLNWHLGLSLEEAGRRVRYAFFNKIMLASDYNKLALGHQMNDNAEQVLLALLRGTGPKGLAGIAPVRDDRIVRPLIKISRTEIEAYVRQKGIVSVADESNTDPRFVRNRIRHHLLPLLASQYNPRIDMQLSRLAEVMHSEGKWIDSLVAAPYREAVLASEQGTLALSAATLRQAHPALSRRLIRMALKDFAGTLQRISFTHVQHVLNLLDGADEKVCHLPGGIVARKSAGRLVLSKSTQIRRGIAGRVTYRPEITVHGPFPTRIEIPAMGIGLRFSPCRTHQLPTWTDVGHDRAYLDLYRLSLPLTVRSVRSGDRFTPLGANGSQKVKKFFIDHKIPRQTRTSGVVLADRRGIVWLVGHRIDDYVKVTTKTTHVLRIEFFLLDT